MNRVVRWGPAAILGAGALLTLGSSTQRPMPLRVPLDSVIPLEIAGFSGRGVPLAPGEAAAAGVTSYLSRAYTDTAGGQRRVWSLYVGYYDSQTQGKTIHSPKNCLPGSGWEALQSSTSPVAVGDHTYAVNRYLLRRGAEQALVLYWYQGRGRVAWNEYRVKWDLLRDAALTHRTEEALVRIVVPAAGADKAAEALATRVAAAVIPAMYQGLPK